MLSNNEVAYNCTQCKKRHYRKVTLGLQIAPHKEICIDCFKKCAKLQDEVAAYSMHICDAYRDRLYDAKT